MRNDLKRHFSVVMITIVLTGCGDGHTKTDKRSEGDETSVQEQTSLTSPGGIGGRASSMLRASAADLSQHNNLEKIFSPLSALKHKGTPFDAAMGLSWDGRFRIQCPRKPNENSACFAQAFRPQYLKGNNGQYDFTKTWSARVNAVTPSNSPALDSPNNNRRHIAVSMDPTLAAPNGNPFRCNANGAFAATGKHDCYQIMIAASTIPLTGDGDGGDFTRARMSATRASVIVKAYDWVGPVVKRIPNPEIVKLVINNWETLRTPANATIPRWEPSLTADGRLMFLDHSNYITNNSQTGNFGTFSDSWSNVKNVRQLVSESAAFKQKYPIARRPFTDAFGRTCTQISDLCGGSYNWISPEGTDLFFTRGVVSNSAGLNLFVVGERTKHIEVLVDGAPNINRYSYVGFSGSPGSHSRSMWSQFGEMPADYPFPSVKDQTVYPLFTAVGYSEVEIEKPLGGYLVYLGMNEMLTGRGQPGDGQRDFMRQGTSYVELPGERRVSKKLSPDVSGNFNTGLLNNGASFPTEYLMANNPAEFPNESVGLQGRGIFLRENGFVSVLATRNTGVNPNSKNLSVVNGPLQYATIEVAYKILRQISGNISLVQKNGSWQIFKRAADNTLALKLWDKTGNAKIFLTSYKLDPDTAKWHQIVVVFRGLNKIVEIYVNGSLLLRSDTGDIASLRASQSSIIVGPGLASAGPAKAAYIVDEFALSPRPLGRDAILERAGMRDRNTSFTSYKTIGAARWPQELVPENKSFDVTDASVPTEIYDALIKTNKFQAAFDLGEKIFNDRNLTGKNISCNTCHESTANFVDVRLNANDDRFRLSPGADRGNRPTRHTPTILNRLFSTRQFADGRAASLVDQVIGPITSPVEMGGEMPKVMEYLRKKYPAEFKAVFDGGPSKNNLALVLAAYSMGQFSDETLFDRYNTGRLQAADTKSVPAFVRGQALFNGKARCVGCHSGPNLTDEKFHNTGSTFDSAGKLFDTGRLKITGKQLEIGAVKTPTLRMIKATAPYFVNGRLDTLDQVVRFYNDGKQTGGMVSPDIMPLGLTDSEMLDLVFFLRNL